MKQTRFLADAVVSALVVLVAEAAMVGLINRHEFAIPAELRRGMWLLPLVAWPFATPASLLGAGAWLGVRRSERRAIRALLAALGAAGAALVGWGVTTGRHFAQVPVRAAFIVALSAASASIVWLAAPRLARMERRSPVGVGLASAAKVVLLCVANALVLPRLYPAFHAALALLALMIAPVASLAYVGEDALRDPSAKERRRARMYLVTVTLLLGTCTLLMPTLARQFERADNVRFIYGERAPVLGHAVKLLTRLHDEPDATGEDASAELSPASSSGPGIDLRGRDIVLISVDALRADHLGSYGYTRPTSPNIDALAAQGARFSHAYAATPHTSYSISSLMTGKYMRPLLLQGAGADSDTLAGLLRTYGYRTAAFYPPAVFFIDSERFTALRDRGIDFEYRRVEFESAARRAEQVERYLSRVKAERRVLLWVHLFEPHEPYVKHEGFDLGDRDVDRYDSEIAATDVGIGKILEAVRKHRPNATIVLTADHGEEFGEHGGRYHGTSVYEEQVRVPLIIAGEGIAPRVIDAPVQTIDVMPSLLAGLAIPRPARVRGRDLGGLLAGHALSTDTGFAFAETDEATMLAEGSLRLICARKLAACQLYDIASDPEQRKDLSAHLLDKFEALRKRLREVESAHGRYELSGLRAEGRSWPEALRRGISGDADAASDVAALLDDADVIYRRKAAEVLFELARPETAPALRLALTRDEDDSVRRWAALALTRLGEGAGRTLELVEDRDLAWRRLAALALAEAGDPRGADALVAWWQSGELSHERARQVVEALGRIKAKNAVIPLVKQLGDVRLRPQIAKALAQIGEPAARPALLDAFAAERYVPARVALGTSLIALGASAEMAPPLTRFLGTPDPLPGGLALAERGGFLVNVGGPDKKGLPKLVRGQGRTVQLDLIIPRGGNGRGVRLLVRGRGRGQSPATVRLGPLKPSYDGKARPPELDPSNVIELLLEPSDDPKQLSLELPQTFGLNAGAPVQLGVWQSEQAELSALALVPLSDELPPPPPQPWTPGPGDQHDDEDLIDDDAP